MRLLTRFGASAAVAAVVAFSTLLPSGAAASVPANGRAWELVTPGAPMTATIAEPTPLGRSGNREVYIGFGPLPGAPSGPVANLNLAVRGENGWTTVPSGFPYSFEFASLEPYTQPIYPVGLNDEDITSIWLSKVPLSADPLPEGDVGLYRRGLGNQFTLIADLGNHQFPFRFPASFDQSENEDHVVFTSEEHLLPSDAGRTEGRSLYESVGSTLRQVDVNTNGTLISTCGSETRYSNGEPYPNGVSADGEEIFFTNPSPHTSCPGPSEVYLREGGNKTIEISASQCTRLDCNAVQAASFAGASASGKAAFITTTQQLTNDDEDELRDLYRYDVTDEELSLVSGALPGVEDMARNVEVHSSVDGSYVYFSAQSGLYLSDPSGLHFVAAGAEEEPQVTPDGHTIVMQGTVNSHSGIFLYHADDDSLTWISNPGSGMLPYPTFYENILGKSLIYRALSNDGNDAFFSSTEQLVPEDVNNVEDIYEWKDGHLGLISSGTDSLRSTFGGASADGKTVLFGTHVSLLPADRDGGEADLYVARIGGGFAEAPPPPPSCEATSCRPAPNPRISRTAPASYGHRSPKHKHRKHKHKKHKHKHKHKHTTSGRAR